MNDGRRTYCTLDHANKRKELAECSPYQFWLEQLRRESEGRIDEGAGEQGPHRSRRSRRDCRGAARLRQGS